MNQEHHLHWNPDTERFEIGSHELHCGDCFELKLPCGHWLEASIEMAHGDHPGWILKTDLGFIRGFAGKIARMP